MNFSAVLNHYLTECDCTALEFSNRSGLSAATISRYRSDKRIPAPTSENFELICQTLSEIALEKNLSQITKEGIVSDFLACENVTPIDKSMVCTNLNTLITALDVNVSHLCKTINYAPSTIYRFRNGSRLPSDPVTFVSSVSHYISAECQSELQKSQLAALLHCPLEALSKPSACASLVRDWMLSGNSVKENTPVNSLLTKLNDFDLNEYIKAIHFDELKVPTVPFLLPAQKTAFGLEEMKKVELQFLKATVLSKSKEDVIMYSDMPMEEMAKDEDFAKKWMFGMALLLKKGLHLHQIHNLDRSFTDMMLGLESWIPMYMTGQISPYYMKQPQNQCFHHLLKVSGAAALQGEAIKNHHADGSYYFTNNEKELSYYRKRAQEMLSHASPLMEVYPAEREADFQAFLSQAFMAKDAQRNLLSAPPMYALRKETLEKLFSQSKLSLSQQEQLLAKWQETRAQIEQVLETSTISDEIALLSEAEFRQNPCSLPWLQLQYTYEDYLTHLQEVREFEATHPHYHCVFTPHFAFRNLNISIHIGKWVLISKCKSPYIHFVIHHPKLCAAIEQFTPPMVE